MSAYNKAHPFIRYDIGDVGILDKLVYWKITLKVMSKSLKFKSLKFKSLKKLYF